MDTIRQKHTNSTNIKSILKSCMVISFVIGVVLYIGFRIVFSEFDTTVLDELVLFGRLWLGSIVVVLATAAIAIGIRAASFKIIKNRRRTRLQLNNAS